MTNTINNYFLNSELSLAAYAALSQNMSARDYLNALIAAGMTALQAREFAGINENNDFISGQGHAIMAEYGGLLSGFSATLFQNNLTGEKTFAIRGTSDPRDLVTDAISIAFLGTTALQLQYEALKDFYQQLINDGKLTENESFTVTGHSLGGFLAESFTVDFALEVEQAMTYNAPGIGGVVAEILEFLGVTNTNVDAANITNIVAENIIGGLGTLLGEVNEVFIEQSLDPIHNHSIATLTDALAVYNLFATIDPTKTPEQLLAEGTSILETASNEAETSLEAVVNALGDLFDAGTTVATGNRDQLYQQIQSIQEKIFIDPDVASPVLKSTYQGLSIVPLTTTSLADEIASYSAETLELAARNSLAYRYALVNLNSFVVYGNDGIYDVHNEDDELELFNEATSTGTLTDEYLTDRCKFLELKINSALIDVAGPEQGEIYYEDRASGLIITEIGANASSFKINHANYIFGSAEGDRIDGGIMDDHLFGGAGADNLFGSVGNDRIEGNAGDDILIGSDGFDTLLGGLDFDRYFVNNGDTVKDFREADGKARGLIYFRTGFTGFEHDTSALGGVWQAEDAANTYRDEAKNITYTLAGDVLTVAYFDGLATHTITVEDYQQGDLNITLIEAGDDLNGTTLNDTVNFTTRGTPEGIFLDTNLDTLTDVSKVEGWVNTADAVRTQIITLNEEINALNGQIFLAQQNGEPTSELEAQLAAKEAERAVKQTEYNDTYGRLLDQNGGNLPRLIQTLGGDDVVVLHDAPGFTNIVVEGGADNDFLSAGDITLQEHSEIVAGVIENDAFVLPVTGAGVGYTLLGGTGNDIVLGGVRADVLEGGDDDDVLQGRGGDDRVFGGEGKDFVAGSVGDDIVTGDGGEDVVTGGDGKDILDGGEGNDDVWGDAEYAAFSQIWTRTNTGGVVQYLLEQDFSGITLAIGSDDRLFGGGGNDLLVGGAADDHLFGGADNDELHGDNLPGQVDVAGDDHLFGEEGTDTLLGGAGNDVLDGGAGTDILHGGNDNDTYYLGSGDGVDIAWDESGSADVIQLRAGITPGDVHLSVDSTQSNLMITLKQNNTPTGDQLILAKWFEGSAVESIQFTDGTVWEAAYIEAATGVTRNPNPVSEPIAALIAGNDAANTTAGSAGSDDIYSLGGNDLVDGFDGNDRLFGGAGNDQLQGNDGNDVLSGEVDDDILFGQAGNDQLFGGEGNDFLSGGEGNDVYRFNIGDGIDAISEENITDDLDSILLGAGIAPSEVYINHSGNDLVIRNTYNANDRLIVRNWYQDPAYHVDHIQFADGTIWNQTTIEANINLPPVANSDSVSGAEDTPIIISAATLTGNDRDPNGNGLTLTQVSNAVHGTVALDTGGNVVFTPFSDFTGLASFQYTETDGRGLNTSGFVTVDVLNTPDAPVAQPDDVPVILNASLGGALIPRKTITVSASGVKYEVVSYSGISGSVSLGESFTQNNSITLLPAPIGGHIDEDWIRMYRSSGSNSIYVNSRSFLDNNSSIGPIVHDQLRARPTEGLDAFIPPATTRLTNNNLVAVWQGYPLDGSGVDLAIQLFSPTGAKIGADRQLNVQFSSGNLYPSIAALGNGGFVVTWESTANGISVDSVEIAGQRFDASGHKVGGEFRVNTKTASFQKFSSAVSLVGGGFFAVWSSYYSDAGDFVIAGQRFDDSGNKIGGEVNLGVASTDLYKSYEVASFNDGGFVLAADNGKAYRYTADGDLLGSSVFTTHFVGNISHISAQLDIAVLTDDRYVVAWGDDTGFHAQLYAANGDPIGSRVVVDTGDPYQSGADVSITAREDGGFVIAWLNDTANHGLTAQLYDQHANPVGNRLQINNQNEPAQDVADLIGLADGGFMGVWTNVNTSSNLDDTVESRAFNIDIGANGLFFTADVLANDTDVDPGDDPSNFILTSVSLRNGQGQVSIVNNQLVFTSDADFSALLPGETLTYIVDYTMTDAGGLASSSTATITINGSNAVPLIVNPVQNQNAFEDAPFSFTLPGNIFHEPNSGDSIANIEVIPASGGEFPSWLTFDQNTYTFIGTPVQADVGEYIINVTAQDSAGFSAVDSFVIKVNNTNDVPVPLNDTSVTDDDAHAVLSYNIYNNPTFDLAALRPDNGGDGSLGFVVAGLQNYDTSGNSVASAGDLNGDGIDDFVISAKNANNYAGASYVVFGRTDGFSASLDLSSLDGANGFVINAANSSSSWNSRSQNRSIASGDVNGDGLNDLIIGDAKAGDQIQGQAYVIYGRTGGFTPSIDLATLDDTSGFVITGILTNDALGASVTTADINNDGIADIIVGAPGVDALNGVVSAGATYIIYGQPGNFVPAFNLASLNGTNGFVIQRQGVSAYEQSGYSLAAAGDVNGDGIDDILIGAPLTSHNGNTYAGATYVVFGQSGDFGPTLDLASLDGTNGLVISGAEINEQTGKALSSAGDVNGDGIDDIIIGSVDADPYGDNTFPGAAYVVFGQNGDFTPSFELSSLDGTNGFIFIGADAYDYTGNSISSAGDINGDGFGDLIIGAPFAAPNGIPYAGVSYMVFGHGGSFAASFNLASINGENGFALQGVDEYDYSGFSVSTAGDVNGDGFNDLIIGALYANPEGRSYAGESYIVFGVKPSVLNNDSDVDGDALTVTKVNGNGATVGVQVTLPSGALLTMNADGAYSYDPNGRFSYLNAGETATDTFTYTVSDGNGGTSSASVTVTINGKDGGEVPPLVVSNALVDQTVNEDAQFSFNIPANTFSGNDLSYNVSLDNGSVLPDWLMFDAVTQTFSGTPGNEDVGTLEVKVTATNTSSASISDTFTLNINNVNDAPVAGSVIGDQVVKEDHLFSFIIPAGAFIDDDVIHGDTLSLSAFQANGNPLPGWLNFDAMTQTFSGTPGNEDVGVLDVKVTAMDDVGGFASDNFTLTVNNVNDALVVTVAIPDQTVKENQLFNFILSEDTFTDVNSIHGDVLSLSATLANGESLPSWLTFDAVTRAFSGMPGNGDAGVLDVKVTATDVAGEFASDNFTLTIYNVIQGTSRSNTLSGTAYSDFIDGMSGNDVINGGDGNDILIGGRGQDVLRGGSGDDVFQVSGDDSNYDTFDGGAGTDTILGGARNDVIRLNNYSGNHTVEVIDGGAGVNMVAGTRGSDTLDLSGTVLVNIAAVDGSAGHDVITGNGDHNVLRGGAGNDVLEGGAGNDTLMGGIGNDVYTITSGSGLDTIFDNKGSSDLMNFSNSISYDQLWFWQRGNDLRIGVVNTSDRVTIQDWFSKTRNQIERIEALDNSYYLLNNQAQQLIQAMSVFNPETQGNLNVSQSTIDEVMPVIAASWQPAA